MAERAVLLSNRPPPPPYSALEQLAEVAMDMLRDGDCEAFVGRKRRTRPWTSARWTTLRMN